VINPFSRFLKVGSGAFEGKVKQAVKWSLAPISLQPHCLEVGLFYFSLLQRDHSPFLAVLIFISHLFQRSRYVETIFYERRRGFAFG